MELTSGRGRLTIAVDTEERGVANAGHPVAAGSQLFFGGNDVTQMMPVEGQFALLHHYYTGHDSN